MFLLFYFSQLPISNEWNPLAVRKRVWISKRNWNCLLLFLPLLLCFQPVNEIDGIFGNFQLVQLIAKRNCWQGAKFNSLELINVMWNGWLVEIRGESPKLSLPLNFKIGNCECDSVSSWSPKERGKDGEWWRQRKVSSISLNMCVVDMDLCKHRMGRIRVQWFMTSHAWSHTPWNGKWNSTKR